MSSFNLNGINYHSNEPPKTQQPPASPTGLSPEQVMFLKVLFVSLGGVAAIALMVGLTVYGFNATHVNFNASVPVSSSELFGIL